MISWGQGQYSIKYQKASGWEWVESGEHSLPSRYHLRVTMSGIYVN